jgi:hypothetical protein
MRNRELAGGRAALAALVKMPLQLDASTLNGSSPHARPAGGYVWDAGYEEAGEISEISDLEGEGSGSDEDPGERLLKGELRRVQKKVAASKADERRR